MNKSSTGTPYMLMGSGSKVLINRGRPKHSSGGALLLSPGSSLRSDSNPSGLRIPQSALAHARNTDILSSKLSRLSIKGHGSYGRLQTLAQRGQRKKYISL